MKKFISVFLCVLFLLTTTVYSFADSDADNQDNDIMSFVKNFEIAGAEISNMYIEESKTIFDTSYMFDDEEITGTVTLTKDTQGNITMISQEGNKNDVAIFKTNGEIILNGEKVIIETKEIINPLIDHQLNLENNILRQRYSIWQVSCPYGISRDYTTHYSTLEVNYAFAQIIAEISMNILIAVIAEKAIPGAQDNLTADVLEDMLADSLHQVLDYIEETVPMGNAMSTATIRNIHNTQGAYIVSLNEYVYKAYVKIYAKRNCEGLYYISGEVYNVIAT